MTDSYPENGERTQVEAVEVKNVGSTEGTRQESQEEPVAKPSPRAAEVKSSLVSNSSVIIIHSWHILLETVHCNCEIYGM